MKTTSIAAALATLAVVGMSSSAFAASAYGSKEANLAAMRMYASQQMSMGLPNPYPGVDLYTGAGFSDFQRFGYSGSLGYGTPYGYGYGYNSVYANPYYGSRYTPWF
jgi:hypothetical protein